MLENKHISEVKAGSGGRKEKLKFNNIETIMLWFRWLNCLKISIIEGNVVRVLFIEATPSFLYLNNTASLPRTSISHSTLSYSSLGAHKLSFSQSNNNSINSGGNVQSKKAR